MINSNFLLRDWSGTGKLDAPDILLLDVDLKVFNTTRVVHTVTDIFGISRRWAGLEPATWFLDSVCIQLWLHADFATLCNRKTSKLKKTKTLTRIQGVFKQDRTKTCRTLIFVFHCTLTDSQTGRVSVIALIGSTGKHIIYHRRQ